MMINQNWFRLSGDVIHSLGILLLLGKLGKTRSCTGVSGVSQVLYLITFICRYVDLGNFYSYYNTSMKIFYISATAFTVFLIFVMFRRTYDRKHDSYWMYLLLTPVTTVCLSSYYYSSPEMSWTFSQYLESVTMVPQFAMIFSMGQAEVTVIRYLVMLFLYRSLYVCNWIYRNHYEGYWDSTSFAFGSVQCLLYSAFFIAYCMADRSHASGSETGNGEKEKLAGDPDPSHGGNYVQVRGLTPYYEKVALAFQRCRLIVHRECFGVFVPRASDGTSTTATSATKTCCCSANVERHAEKPRPEGLDEIPPPAAGAAGGHLAPEPNKEEAASMA